MAKNVQRVEIFVETLLTRLQLLLSIEEAGGQVGNLIEATEKLLDNYAARLTDKSSFQVLFVENEY